jgi:hypothetical protein
MKGGGRLARVLTRNRRALRRNPRPRLPTPSPKFEGRRRNRMCVILPPRSFHYGNDRMLSSPSYNE